MKRINICRGNEPVAEIRAIPAVGKEPRPMGVARWLVHMDESFLDPLPDELLDLFEGNGKPKLRPGRATW
jgi:antitoxin (DNA-binding transcriptional repressor) of toxin-antitoxin stability system